MSILILPSCGGGGSDSPAKRIPAMTAQPSDITVLAGETATFTVSADGNPAPTFQWERGGSGGWSPVSGAKDKVYTFTTQAADHAATFRALASNTQGSATSNVATLFVNAPPTFTAVPTVQTVTAGGSLAITATATAHGTLSYQWRKDGQPLPGATGAAFNLGNLSSADSGIYDVVATSTLNRTTVTATGNLVTLNVVPLPAPTLMPSASNPRRGETVSLLPSLKDAVRATLGTSPGATDLAASVTDGVAIPTTATTGTQVYYLRAFNAAGASVDATATVTHQTVSIVAILPAISTIAAGGQAQFSATVTGGLKGTVQWEFSSGSYDVTSGQWTAPTTPGTCTITATSEDDATQAKTLTVTVLPGAAKTFALSFPNPVVLGESNLCAVTALDAYGNTATGYAGALHFTSSDPMAQLPADQGLVKGVGSFPVRLMTSGTQSLAVADTTDPITGTQTGITVQYTAPSITVQPMAQAVDPGCSAGFTVTATGVPAPTLAWESSTDGTTWGPASGAITSALAAGGATSTLTFMPQATDSGMQFRAVAQSVDGGTTHAATSSAAKLTVACGSVYIGAYSTIGSVKHAGYWRDTTWVSLPELSPDHDSQVNVVVLTATDVYAGGYCRDSNNLMIPGYWKSGVWVRLSGQGIQVTKLSLDTGTTPATVYATGNPETIALDQASCYWANGVRYSCTADGTVAFRPLNIVGETKDGSTMFVVSGARTHSNGQRSAGSYIHMDSERGLWSELMPPQDACLINGATGFAPFAGSKKDASKRWIAGWWDQNANTWVDRTPPKTGTTSSSSDYRFVYSITDYNNKIYMYVGPGIPHFWLDGTWVQAQAPGTVVVSSLFVNGSGYYMAGMYELRPGYLKNNVWNWVSTRTDTTPTCIAAR